MTQTDQRLKQAAIKWWEARRPLAFDLSQHLDNPAVNCLDGHDSELAKAVAATIKASKKKTK